MSNNPNVPAGLLPAAPIQTAIASKSLVQVQWAGWLNLLRLFVNAGGGVQGATLQPFVQSSPISLTAVATTSVISFSGAPGQLVLVGCEVSTTTGAGSGTAFIDIIADGVTFSIPLYNGQVFNPVSLTLATSVIGNGGSAGNTAAFQLQISFTNSLTVQLRVSATTLAAGAVIITAMWGHS